MSNEKSTQTVHQYTISSENYSRMMALYDADGRKTVTDLFTQVFEIGLWQLEYRRKMNKAKAQEQKEFRAFKREHPEMFPKRG